MRNYQYSDAYVGLSDAIAPRGDVGATDAESNADVGVTV